MSRGSPLLKRLEMRRAAGWSEGAFFDEFGEKSLDAKYHNTAILMIPLMLFPKLPPPIACILESFLPHLMQLQQKHCFLYSTSPGFVSNLYHFSCATFSSLS
ncbi:hypothetical protein Sjap_018915 [Stephania japonica]|uniref:Uncharacterized protein n=1 Tax=Stephania japonica TaxID=461633 RepID=A0AAP0I8Z1_9MAGN